MLVYYTSKWLQSPGMVEAGEKTPECDCVKVYLWWSKSWLHIFSSLNGYNIQEAEFYLTAAAVKVSLQLKARVSTKREKEVGGSELKESQPMSFEQGRAEPTQTSPLSL